MTLRVTRPASTGRRAGAVATVGLAVVVMDALSKQWARAELADDRHAVGPIGFRVGSNSGVAFGVGAGAPGWVIVAVTTAVVVLLGVAAVWMRPAPAAGLVVGGGLANLLDRIGDGAVTDFITVPHWPTFNLADTAITCGAAWLAITALRTPSHPEGRPHA